MFVVGGVTYIAYLLGVNPAQAYFFANMLMGRRGRLPPGGLFRHGGGFGGWGGVGGRNNIHRGRRW
jgi:hypothetical protein